MSTARPYCRTFLVGTIWFAAIGTQQVAHHSGHWTTYPRVKLVILAIAWILTALLSGVVVTRFEKLRSWWTVGIGTVAVSFAVLGLMLVTVERIYGRGAPPKFETPDQMMKYAAAETAKWVKKDRGIDLDYSLKSIQVIEEELARIAKEVNKTNPQQGTFGLAMGYGAYIGEVLRRRHGGSWAVEQTGGAGSYRLTTKSNTVIFPVNWCWKRLINGEEDNVYHKAVLFNEMPSTIKNAAHIK